MEGLIRYLLLNPAGEEITAYQSAMNSFIDCVDKEHHETFFIGHPVLISSQNLLRILIRQFNESLMYAGDTRDVKLVYIPPWSWIIC